MKNIFLVVLSAIIVIILLAYYYEKRINKQTSEERDTLLDVIKTSSETASEVLNSTSKASADILRSIKDSVYSNYDKYSKDDEVLLEFKDKFQEVLNDTQLDVETKINELKIT